MGIHSKATAALAKEAVEAAYAYYPEWSATPPSLGRTCCCGPGSHPRAQVRIRRVAGVRSRQDVARSRGGCLRSHRFLRILCARDAAAQPARAVVQMPGEHDEMLYIPLGVGMVIPPWNFPLAIMVGMTAAALVTGNTVVIKPSSETPTIAAKFAEVLLEAGFPPNSVFHADGQRRGGGRRAGGASQDALRRLHRLARRRPAHQRTGRETAAGADLDQARDRGNGRQGRHRRGSRGDLDKAVDGVLFSAFGYQGQKCSACSRAIVDQAVYDRVPGKADAEGPTLKSGPPTIRRTTWAR